MKRKVKKRRHNPVHKFNRNKPAVFRDKKKDYKRKPKHSEKSDET